MFMKESLDFYWPSAKPKFRIKAEMDGISGTVGHNGYRVLIWEAITYDGQKPLAKFVVELNGKLFTPSKDELNIELCQTYDLGTVIISEARR